MGSAVFVEMRGFTVIMPMTCLDMQLCPAALLCWYFLFICIPVGGEGVMTDSDNGDMGAGRDAS